MKSIRSVLKGGKCEWHTCSRGWKWEAVRSYILYLNSGALLPASKLDWRIRAKILT
jgi:hypothetical protein